MRHEPRKDAGVSWRVARGAFYGCLIVAVVAGCSPGALSDSVMAWSFAAPGEESKRNVLAETERTLRLTVCERLRPEERTIGCAALQLYSDRLRVSLIGLDSRPGYTETHQQRIRNPLTTKSQERAPKF